MTDDRRGTNGDALVLDARTDAPRDRYRFHAPAGVHSPDAFRTPALLLLEVLWDDRPGTVGCVQANWGVPGVVLAAVADHVHCVDSDARAADACRRNARLNDVAAATTVDCAPTPGAVDAFTDLDAVAYAPRPYEPLAQAKRRLVDGLRGLVPGGTLYVAATPTAGLERFRDALDAVDASPREVRSHGDCVVLAATRPDRIPDAAAAVERTTHRERVAGVDLAVVTEPGVFAAGGLDHGTRLLIEHATVDPGDRVLDLCCGAGPIGAWTAAATPECEVALTDADAVATACADRTLDATADANDAPRVRDATVHTADCLDAVRSDRFDRVLANPPTHAGDPVLRALLRDAHDVLAPGGDCQLVHHASLDLDPQLAAFDHVETVARGDEHVVRRAKR
jgi:16S rRNA (guanine1207-N2)-methyltransferase